MNCQASASLEEVVRKGYLTNHFTAEEIKARWHAILYDQPTAEYISTTPTTRHTHDTQMLTFARVTAFQTRTCRACAARLAEIEFDLPLLAYLEQRPSHVASMEKPHEPPPAEVRRTTFRAATTIRTNNEGQMVLTLSCSSR